MAAGTEGGRLLEAVEALIRELDRSDGAVDDRVVPGSALAWRVDEPFAGLLSSADEELAGELTEALQELALKASAYRDEEASRLAAAGVLRGAEFLIRSELGAGKRERLDELVPSIVYLLTIPYLGQSAALGLSRRMRELLR